MSSRAGSLAFSLSDCWISRHWAHIFIGAFAVCRCAPGKFGIALCVAACLLTDPWLARRVVRQTGVGFCEQFVAIKRGMTSLVEMLRSHLSDFRSVPFLVLIMHIRASCQYV
mmetsp:Transcript_65314/g.211569  ORF Transcript_65314/g.211569 Transcript_65314/m.211569 type:complete len:112 (+) Transcript_65314:2121-2456(+)